MLMVDDNSLIQTDSKKLDIDFITDSINNQNINYFYLGRRSYKSAWKLQKEIHLLVKNCEIPSTVLFLEHDNVYTLGKNADKNYLLSKYPDVDVIETDRGGQITYHGPGQLVGYPIINLNNYNKSISWFVSSIESIIINTLERFKITSSRKEGFPGVWIEDEKICAMGVRIAQWVTMHGFALNVNPEMKYFDGLIPCGIMEYGVTSIYNNINQEIDYYDLVNILIKEFNNIFNK
ncbi:MAG: lipoyl(octanoyl) transferase [Candidatus Marinimicrobia bacterium]|nr:lipoyl(octanoyl) transferase [Candidatus Neomarinimicrobiota bacterium]